MLSTEHTPDLSKIATRQSVLPEVPESVSGTELVSIEELSKMLGRPAWRVWECLLHRRDRWGITHATRSGIANAEGYEPMSDRMVKKGLTRLRAAGLVEDMGWGSIVVENEGESHRIDVFKRRVLGARIRRLKGYKKHYALVPVITLEWMQTAFAHGGVRPNSGRKKSLATLQKEDLRRARALARNTVYGLSYPRNNVNTVGLDTRFVGMVPYGVDCAVLDQKGPAIKISQGSILSNYDQGLFLRCAQKETAALIAPLARFAPDADTVLVTPGERRSKLPLITTPITSISAPPWMLDLPMIEIQPPPLLDKDFGPRRSKSLVARLYRSAFINRFNTSKGASACFARGEKIDRLITEMIKRFKRKQVSPGSWFAWCFDVAIEYELKVEPWWVLSPSRFDKKLDWFHETHAIETGRRIMVAAHRELYERWRKVNHAARVAQSEHDIQDAVREHLPPDVHDRLVAKVHEQVAKLQPIYDRLAQSGDDWIW